MFGFNFNDQFSDDTALGMEIADSDRTAIEALIAETEVSFRMCTEFIIDRRISP